MICQHPDYLQNIFIHSASTKHNIKLKRSVLFHSFGAETEFLHIRSRNCYHVPQDNLDIIKPEIMEDMAKLLFLTVVNMANHDGPIR